MQLKRYRVKYNRINHIFISHLHGDHYLGLAGLIFSMHLFGRKTALHIYGNPELEKILSLQIKVSDTTLLYPLIFHPLEPGCAKTIYEDQRIQVKAFPLLHRVPTHGFRFNEKTGKRKIIREALSHFDVSTEMFDKLKNGEDIILQDGRVIPNASVTTEPDKPRSYAYCSDTGHTDSYLEHIMQADMLYHEATFMQEKEASAREKMHSTAMDAAQTAIKAGVRKLLIGHYSARYDELDPLLAEAKSVFPNSLLTRDGMVFHID
jgi:ribonuclease Z